MRLQRKLILEIADVIVIEFGIVFNRGPDSVIEGPNFGGPTDRCFFAHPEAEVLCGSHCIPMM
jgi:hypothetical protein